METNGQAEQAILKLSEEWAAAIVSNDADAIGRFMHDDWVIVGSDGATTKHEFLSSVRSGDVTHASMQLVSDVRVRIYGNTAVFTGRVTNNGQYKGQSFSADEWTSDVFIRSDGRWLCVLSHITSA